MAKIDDSVKKKVPELRFKGFTDDWEERKLSDLFIKGGSGGTPKSTNKAFYDGDIPFLGISDITKSNGFINNTEKHISSDGLNSSAAWIVSKGAISLAMYASVGKLAILNIDAATSQAFYNMIFDDYDLRDLVYQRLNKANELSEWNKLISTGTQSNLNADKVKNFQMYLPKNHDEIKLISTFFKQIDNTIALHQRKLDLLKEQKKGYLQKMFPKNGAKVPELRFAGFADDWEERKLGEVIDIENGYAFKSEYFSDEEKRHIVLTPGSVKIGGGFQKDKGRYYDVSGVFPEKFIFKPGNIFITMTDLTPTAQSLGYPAIVPRDDNVYLHNQRLGKIINNTTNPEFLYTLLTTDTYHKEIVSSASGTTVKHSSVSKILDFKSAIPNIDEQKLIGSFFKELDNTIALHQRKLDLLKEQKKGFLQKMFV